MAAAGHGVPRGLEATTPQTAAGRITEPLVWVPRANGTMPQATAAAEPMEEPPGVGSGFQGLRVGPGGKRASSAVTVLPSTVKPARSRFTTTAAERSCTRPAWRAEPFSVGMPSVSMTSLIPTGTPLRPHGPLAVEPGPGLHPRLPFGDPAQAVLNPDRPVSGHRLTVLDPSSGHEGLGQRVLSR